MKSSKKTKLILSCDTKNEIDDQFAIYYALKSPEIDLLGVVSTQNQIRNGENSVDIYHEEAKKIMKLSKSKVPCFKGSRRPLNIEKLEKSAGVEFIISAILKSKEKIVVASTGPCTDLATAILLEPMILKKARFLWLGGYRNESEAKRFFSGEIDFDGDRLAAEILLNSKAEIVLIPVWGVTDSLIINCRLLKEELLAKNMPVTNYLADLIECNWKRFGIFHHLIPRTLKRFWVMFDIAAVAVAKNYGVKSVEKKSSNFKKIIKIDQHKILAQFEKYILD